MSGRLVGEVLTECECGGVVLWLPTVAGKRWPFNTTEQPRLEVPPPLAFVYLKGHGLTNVETVDNPPDTVIVRHHCHVWVYDGRKNVRKLTEPPRLSDLL